MMKPAVMVVRREVLAMALADRAYGPKLDGAKTLREVVALLEAFCVERGYRVAEV